MSDRPRPGAPRPDDEDPRDLLGVYALDAVDEDERAAVDALLLRDPAAATELAELRAVAAELGAAAAVPPPPAVRAAVLDAVRRESRMGTGAAEGRTSQDHDGVVVPLRRRRSTPVRWSLAAAAAVVLAVAGPGVVAWQQHDRAVRAEARAGVLVDALADPAAVLVRGALADGGEAVAVLGGDRGVVVVEGLPALDEDRVYQVWAMRDGTPVPAGLLEVDDGGAAQELEAYRPGDGVALSVEPAGGSEQPTTTPLVVLLPG